MMNPQDELSDGFIQTVLGPQQANAGGAFLVHEHLLGDVTPPGAFPPGTPQVEINLENVWDVRYQWCGHYGNQILNDVELLTNEMKILKKDGGCCVVEQTSRGLRPDPEGLAQISRDSGIWIVAGTGFYTAEFAGRELAALDQQDISFRIYSDLKHGIDDTFIRAGFIGEIGLSTPPHPDEIKALKGAADAQGKTGAGMCIHPPRDAKLLPQLLEIISKSGGMVKKTAVAHLERTMPSMEAYLELARTGCFLELDFFGLESGYYPFATVDLPNDAGRLTIIRTLIDHGHLGQILVSHDICHKSRLRRFGGEGYGHIFRNIVPMMRARGFQPEEIKAILTENPQNLLAIH